MERSHQEVIKLNGDNQVKRVAIYMRVSTLNQEEEQTIDNQRIELMQRIEKGGYILSEECIYADEGWSGATLERPDLDRLRNDATNGRFDILYFYDRGRLSRKFVHQEIVIQELREAGVECVSLHDINGDSHEERLMGGVMGIFAEYERVKITERMRIGKYRKVKENKKLLGYNPKYGYDYLPRIKKGPDARDGQFVINEQQAKNVRMIFGWAASGMSKYGIRTELFNHGIMPSKAKNDTWSTSVIDRMLRDSTYMGDHIYNKSESVESKNPRKTDTYSRVLKGSRKKRPEAEWMHVEVPAIITRELFNKVQKQLAKNKRARSNNKKHDYLVAGLINCACGQARTGNPANGCLYYRCNDRLNHPLGTRQCSEKAINAAVLDDVVWRNIKELLTHPELVFEHAKKWQEGVSPLRSRLEYLQKQQESLNEKEQRLAQAYTEGIMSKDVYRAQFEGISDARIRLLTDIRTMEDELANKPPVSLEKLVDGMIKLVEDLGFAERRQIIQKVIDKVIATKEEITVCGFIPILATEQVELNGQYRNRRPPKRRQINTF